MPQLRLFTRIIILLLPCCAIAQVAGGNEPFTERTPAYFVERYGSSKSAKTQSGYSFVHPGRGNVDVKGQFSIREYRQGDITVLAVFNLPSLKLAGVKLQLHKLWTPEQIEAALAAYGADWKPAKANSPIKVWVTPRGAKAVFLLSSLEIHSPEIVLGIESSLREMDAKRKAIPKF